MMDGGNLDEIHVNYWNNFWYIMHPNNIVTDDWNLDGNHLVSDNTCNIATLRPSSFTRTEN